VPVKSRHTNDEATSTFDGEAYNILGKGCPRWNNFNEKGHYPGSCLSLRKANWLCRKFSREWQFSNYLLLFLNFFGKVTAGQVLTLEFTGSEISFVRESISYR